MRKTLIAISFILLGVSVSTAQQANSATATLDINVSSASGSAPYSAVVMEGSSFDLTVSGNANMPWVLSQANAISVGEALFQAGMQMDIGPTATWQVLLDGHMGPFSPFLANTGATGSATFSGATPCGAFPTGQVAAAFQVIVVDFTLPPHNFSVSAATDVTFSSSGMAPTANAGPDQSVFLNDPVTLDGTMTSLDPEGGVVSFSWVQTMGNTVALTGADTVNPTFSAPSASEVLEFELTASDGCTSTTDTIMVTVQTSFTNDVHPIWTLMATDCAGCHNNNNSGCFDLDGITAVAFPEVTMETPKTSGHTFRVDTATPSNSLILQKPLGMLGHGGGTVFSGTIDPNYITLLNWITEGAQNN